MRNFENYVTEGKKKITDNSRFDLQTEDFAKLCILAKTNATEALLQAFYAGVEAGSRIQQKKERV